MDKQDVLEREFGAFIDSDEADELFERINDGIFSLMRLAYCSGRKESRESKDTDAEEFFGELRLSVWNQTNKRSL